MVLKVISSTPSPYARKVRIQLLEKDIPFELKTEVPWDHTTETPKYNPLQKLPVLIFDDGRDPIYESSFILQYVEEKLEPRLSLTPNNSDERLVMRNIEILADSICDAWILQIFEKRRGDKMSKEWNDRQARKVEGGVKDLARRVDEKVGDFIVGEKLTLADLAVVSMVDFLRMREHPLMDQYHGLCEYADKMNQREAFKQTKPYPFEIKDKIV